MRSLASRFALPFSLAMALAITAAACGSSSSPTTPTTPTPNYVTDNFSGSFVQQGYGQHTFTVATSGTVTITLTSVAPLSTMALGVGVMTWDGTTCGAIIGQTASATTSAAALSGTLSSGNYCLRVFDSGNVPADWTVNYTVQVVHP